MEGCDGTGKSTQAQLLVDHLRTHGKQVVLTHEPTSYAPGILAKQYAMTEKHDPWVLALLFAADRRIHCNNLIRKALSAGKWVVADRYVHSSLAYQGAEGVDERWIRLINSPCLWPDISLVIDLGAKTAFARSRSKSLRMNFFEKELQFREKARRRFLRLCERGDAIRVDGRGTTEEVFRRIIATIQKSAGNCFLD